MMTKNLKQPKVLVMAFLNALFERAGFYLFTAMLVLYVKEDFNYSDTAAFALFGVFMGLVYITPAIGGYLADNVLGIRRSLVIGLILEGIGLALLGLPYHIMLFVGLACLVLGVGFFKTAPTHLMARTYEENDPRIDSGFTIFYMAINVGSFISIAFAGYLQRYFGWHVSFLVASLCLWCALGSYYAFRHLAVEADSEPGKKKLSWKVSVFTLVGIILSIMLCSFLVSQVGITDIFFVLAAVIVFSYFTYEIIKEPSRENKLKIIACVILLMMGFVFYILYYQAYTSINLFVDRSVNRMFFGFSIPTVAYLALNPFWILLLSPLLAFLYGVLAKRNKDLAVTTKFPIGLLIVSLCFLLLSLSTHFANADAKISSLWIVFFYFLYSLGEMFIGALGVAMVTRIAPKRLYGVMMGGWFLVGMGLAGSMSGLFASLASISENVQSAQEILHIYSHAFSEIGIVGLIATVAAFIIGPYLKRIAKLS